MKVYELVGSFNNLQELMEMDEFRGNVDIEEALSGIQGQLEDKVDNIGNLIVNISLPIAMLKAEEQRLKERRTNIEKEVERIKDWLSTEIKKLDKDGKGVRIEGKLHTVTLSKSSFNKLDESINLDLIPDEFKKVEVKVDKQALKKALKEGAEIEGARLVESRSFRIK